MSTQPPLVKPARSLRATLAWYVALPVPLGIVLVSWLVSAMLHSEWERSLEEDVELVGRAIRAPITRALEQGQLQQVTETILSTQDIGRVYGVSVYGDEGQLIATAGDVDPDHVVTDLHDVAEEGRHGGYERLGGRRVYSYFVPLADSGGRFLGLLQLTRRQREMEETLFSRRLMSLLIALGGAAGLATLALWGHHRALARHLGSLARDISVVRQGDRQHRAENHGPHEIASLAQAINDMLDSIARAEEEISRRRQQESTLQEQLARSEKIAALGQLAAGVAHELGTPLSTIDGYAQRLKRSSDHLSPAQDKALDHIRHEVQRTEGIVRELLELGRSQSRSMSACPPRQPAESALHSLEEMLHQRQQQCRITGDEPLPAIAMDSGRVEQALANLLRNASQASPPGAQLELRIAGEAEHIAYAMHDSGPGVDAEVAKHMFEPFFTTKAVGQGTGLGLAVVHSVAEEHGGSVSLENLPQGGAVFTLRLARHPSTANEQPQHAT
ncbi:MAG: HAMP domain-containing protein [Planctomycetota bacterium]|nr:MAG: HAMP domain-containing protein [Planctomycetota bacterium]